MRRASGAGPARARAGGRLVLWRELCAQLRAREHRMEKLRLLTLCALRKRTCRALTAPERSSKGCGHLAARAVRR